MATAQVEQAQAAGSTPNTYTSEQQQTQYEPLQQQPPSAIDLILNPTIYPKYNFSFADFLKRDYQFPVEGDRPVCKDYQQGYCPLAETCPRRHPKRSNYNHLICKHWLRGLCKKGTTCEFLHEYNLRGMPECTSFSRHGTCPNGKDCLYLHIDPALKAQPCVHYERGFCPLGPRCAARHVKKWKKICEFYMAGFCPDGLDCTRGAHPLWREKNELDPPVVAAEKQDPSAAGAGTGTAPAIATTENSHNTGLTTTGGGDEGTGVGMGTGVVKSERDASTDAYSPSAVNFPHHQQFKFGGGGGGGGVGNVGGEVAGSVSGNAAFPPGLLDSPRPDSSHGHHQQQQSRQTDYRDPRRERGVGGGTAAAAANTGGGRRFPHHQHSNSNTSANGLPNLPAPPGGNNSGNRRGAGTNRDRH